MPFWLYAWAASAVLVVSLLCAAWFAAEPASALAGARTPPPEVGFDRTRFAHTLGGVRPGLRGLAVGLLGLTVATGLCGNPDPYRNFAPTFFWVVFGLGFTYATALCGDAWAALNPWRVLAETVGRVAPGAVRGRWRYPPWLGDWPALGLYLGFVWCELFVRMTPHALGFGLVAYTALNAVGVWLFGSGAWFRHGEFFSVFLHLVGRHAPLDYRRPDPTPSDPAPRGHLGWRRPGAALIDPAQRPRQVSTVVFALAMLATTTVDGLGATQWWVQQFWADPTGLVTALAGTRPMLDIGRLRPWYVAWETAWLVALPFVYLGALAAALALAKVLTRSRYRLRELVLDFGLTLLPIALAYHLAHYATLLLNQGLKILSLVSDPFGRGWDLFGTAWRFRAPYLPDMGWVWHAQVLVVLLGHVASLVLAHRVAARRWPGRGRALASQLPLLGLMVAFTVAGLWLLAQPLTTERLG